MKTFIVFVALCQLAFGLPQLAFQGGSTNDRPSNDPIPKPPQPQSQFPSQPKPSNPEEHIVRQGVQGFNNPSPSSSSSNVPSRPINNPIQPSASASGSLGSSSSGISASSGFGNGRPISSSGIQASASETQETVVKPLQPAVSVSKQSPVVAGSSGSASGSSGSSSGASGAPGASVPRPKPTGSNKDEDDDDERERRALSDTVTTTKPIKPVVADSPKGVKTPVDRLAPTEKPDDEDKTDAPIPPRKSFFPSRD